jgi:hypothetical protein
MSRNQLHMRSRRIAGLALLHVLLLCPLLASCGAKVLSFEPADSGSGSSSGSGPGTTSDGSSGSTVGASTPDSPDEPFAGTWSCSFTADGGSLTQSAASVTITENPLDGGPTSLTVAIQYDAPWGCLAGPDAPAPLYVSGSVASQEPANQAACDNGGGNTVTVTSFTLTLSGDTMTWNESEVISVGPGTGTVAVVVGTCTKSSN